MKNINIIYLFMLGLAFTSFSACLSEDDIINRANQVKLEMKKHEIVNPIVPANIGMVKEISYNDCNTSFKNNIKNIIDIRNNNIYNNSHIIGAVNIPYHSVSFTSKMNGFDKNNSVTIYGDPKTTSRATRLLQGLGFKKIYNLSNGYQKCISENMDLGIVTEIMEKNVPTNINISEYMGLMNENNTILDVNPIEEFRSGSIEGAVHVDWNDKSFENKVKEIVSNSKPVLLVSRNGIVGDHAALTLKAMGYSKVYNLIGGSSAYVQGGNKLIPLKIEGDPIHLNEKEFEKAIIGNLGTIIDVRTLKEYDVAHIPNSIQIDVKKRDFESLFSKVDKSKPVFLYCRTGVRSMNATKIAQKMGYTVYNLDHGFKGWQKHHKRIIGEAHSINTGEEGC